MTELDIIIVSLLSAAALTACFFALRCCKKSRTVTGCDYELLRSEYIEKKHIVKLHLAKTVYYTSAARKDNEAPLTRRKTKKLVVVQAVSPTSFEALCDSSDEIVRRFASEIVEAVADPSLVPSWYKQKKRLEQLKQRQASLDRARAEIDADFSSIYEPLKLRVAELARELEGADARLAVVSADYSALDQKLKKANKSFVSRVAFRVFNSKKKREALTERHTELDSELLDIGIDISSLEEEMKECVHRMLTVSKERGEKLAALEREREHLEREFAI